jgi:hypothetical protein
LTAKSIVLVSLLAIAAWANPAHAARSYDNCTGVITSLPAVIDTPGIWCLKQNLSTAITTGNAITINTDDVTVDCKDFILDGSSAGLGTDAIGIYTSNHSRATVRHCNVNGFGWGFVLLYGSKYVIERNRLFGITFVGMSILGDGTVIRYNRVLNTGRTNDYIDAHAINAAGSMDVYDNTVSGVVAAQGGGGFVAGIGVDDISASNVHGSNIRGNRVSGLKPDSSGQAIAIGAGSSYTVLRNNIVIADSGGTTQGLSCGAAFIRARNNLVNGFSIPMSNCGDAGGNDISP